MVSVGLRLLYCRLGEVLNRIQLWALHIFLGVSLWSHFADGV